MISKKISVVIVVLLISLWSTHAFSITEDEKNNISVYEKVADGVVNVTSTAIQMDFFFNALPTQGRDLGQAPLLIQKAIS